MGEGEPADLLAAYKAALESGGTVACAPLLKILEDAAKKDLPIASLQLRKAALGAPGAAALAAMLQRDSFLTCLNLEENQLGDDGVVHVSNALRRHQAVFRLDLGYNKVTGRGVKALASLLLESTSLLCLDLSGNNLWSPLSYVTPSSMSTLAPLGRALASPSCKLQLLHLDQADVEPKGLGALVDGLLENKVLVNLRLGENNLDVKSAHVLARFLEGNQTLTSLDLRNNQLGDAGAAVVGAALRRNAGLQCLVLWNNAIQPTGLASFAEAFMAEAAAATETPNATLQILDLGSNVVGRDGAEALKAALVRQAAPLHTLGLADTALGEEGGIAIAEALEGNGRLQRVDLRRNRLGLAGLMALHLSMKTNEAVRELALDTVETNADNCEVQQQFQAEIVAACQLNVVRHGGAATATASGVASEVVPRAMQMMSELSFNPPADLPADVVPMAEPHDPALLAEAATDEL